MVSRAMDGRWCPAPRAAACRRVLALTALPVANAHEARRRRARAVARRAGGEAVLVPDGPPSHTWAIDDRHGDLIGVADGSTVEGAFLAWCELAGIAPDEWRGAVVVSSEHHWKRYRWRGGAWHGAYNKHQLHR